MMFEFEMNINAPRRNQLFVIVKPQKIGYIVKVMTIRSDGASAARVPKLERKIV